MYFDAYWCVTKKNVCMHLKTVKSWDLFEQEQEQEQSVSIPTSAKTQK